VEDDLEDISGVVSNEVFLNEWRDGIYACSQCDQELYSSHDKWRGPCAWPSWRKPVSQSAVRTHDVFHDEWTQGYNGYKCEVLELYCSQCNLFLGHQFADAAEKGDTHPAAEWRH